MRRAVSVLVRYINYALLTLTQRQTIKAVNVEDCFGDTSRSISHALIWYKVCVDKIMTHPVILCYLNKESLLKYLADPYHFREMYMCVHKWL